MLCTKASRRMLIVSIVIWSAVLLISSFQASASSRAYPPPPKIGELWTNALMNDYGLPAKEIQALAETGLKANEIQKLLESLYPFPRMLPQTGDIVALAEATGITPIEAIKAYEIAVKHRRDPVWIAGLYRECGSWDTIQSAFVRLHENRNLIHDTEMRQKRRLDGLQKADVLGRTSGAPVHVLQELIRRAGDDNTVLGILFMSEINSRGKSGPHITATLEDLKGDWATLSHDLSYLWSSWPPRAFPEHLIPQLRNYSQSGAAARSLASVVQPSEQMAPEATTATTTSSQSQPTPSLVDPSSMYSTARVSPFKPYFDGHSETINPSTGALIIKQTDFTLPGKYGFDFSFTRIYNNQLANLELPRVEGYVAYYIIHGGSTRSTSSGTIRHNESYKTEWMEETWFAYEYQAQSSPMAYGNVEWSVSVK